MSDTIYDTAFHFEALMVAGLEYFSTYKSIFLSFSGTASSTDSPLSARNALNAVMDRIRGKCGKRRNKAVVPRCHTSRQGLM